jgi:hypothetical protein
MSSEFAAIASIKSSTVLPSTVDSSVIRFQYVSLGSVLSEFGMNPEPQCDIGRNYLIHVLFGVPKWIDYRSASYSYE